MNMKYDTGLVWFRRDLRVVDNAALIFNRSDALTYAGVISGTGSLTKSGGGTLTLTGASTYAGGTTITAGTLQEIWSDFDPATSPKEASDAGFRGSDQAWISYRLGRDAEVWPSNAGIYSIRDFGN